MKKQPILLTKDEELRLAKSSSFKSEVRSFESGAIRDKETDKEDYTETISWSAFKRYAKYMTGKKSKYGAGNFKMGIPVESYERSLLRHVQKYMENKYEGGQVETNEDHLAACVFNIFGIMHEEDRQNKKSVV